MINLPCPPLNWPRFSSLLDAAIDVPLAERAAWLETLHGEDAEVKAWLARVLGSPSTQGGLRTGQFHNIAQAPQDAFAAGDRFGPYCLMAPLGKGGMAEVWRAAREDDGPRREVALKLPHAEFLGSAARRRFARERDTLAGLSHPNIAQLYDAGTSGDGLPYLALELVQGAPITQACSTGHATLERRVDLVLQVLQGLAYAHQRLIVHRDIKPSNVLVTADGGVKLLDFGIAKLLDPGTQTDAALTQPLSRLSTPAYAAPEQLAGGTITVATDLFSTGVLLFELCTGQRPFDRVPAAIDAPAAPLASQRADSAACGAPEKQRLAARLRGDLDAVLARALCLDTHARYASADAFAADLRAWRQGLPVRARRIGWAARARKFVRRNPIGVALAAVLVLTIAAGTGGIAWQAHRAAAQSVRANAIKDFMIGLFKEAYPKDSNQPGGTMTARQLLDRGAGQADAAFAGDPATEIELLTALSSIDDAFRDNARTQQLLARRLELSRRLYGSDDPRVLDNAIDLAWNYAEWSRPREGAALLDTIRAPIMRRFGDTSLQWAQWLEVRAQVLTATEGGSQEALATSTRSAQLLEDHYSGARELVDALFVLMECQFITEAYGKAQATAVRIRQVGAAQGDFDAMDDLSVRLAEAVILAADGRPDQADAALQNLQVQALRIIGQHGAQYLDATDIRARLAHLRGDRSAAFAMFAGATGSAFWALDYGAALAREGRPAMAVPLLEAALSQQQDVTTQQEGRLREMRGVLGDAYDQLGRTEDARRVLLSVRGQAMRDGPEDGRAVQAARERWARFLLDRGDTGGAAAEFGAVLALARKAATAPASRAATGLARIALALGDVAEADRMSSRAAALLAAAPAGYDVRIGVETRLARARCLAAMGRPAEAYALAADAAADAGRFDAPESPQLARARATVRNLDFHGPR